MIQEQTKLTTTIKQIEDHKNLSIMKHESDYENYRICSDWNTLNSWHKGHIKGIHEVLNFLKNEVTSK